MLLRGCPGQRLEPVGIVGCPLLDRPLLHGLRNLVRNKVVQRSTLIHRLVQRQVDLLRKARPHHTVRKNILPVNIRNVESFFHTYSALLPD